MNTLYVSACVDPFTPGYMLLHFAIHAVIVKDALHRTTLPKSDVLNALPRKRGQPSDLTSKRESIRLRGEAAYWHSLETSINVDKVCYLPYLPPSNLY